MKSGTADSRSVWKLIPTMSAMVFIIFYIVSTTFYPGGSQFDQTSEGFSWMDNYWCNLLSIHAINGQVNPARPIAMMGMLFLGIGLAVFWINLPRQAGSPGTTGMIVKISGTLAILVSFLLFSDLNHDLITNLASLLAIIAVLGTFVLLYKQQNYILLLFGLLNLLLVAINNYVYRDPELLGYLPVIQKITFLNFLTWVCCVNIYMYIKAGRIKNT